MGQKGRKIINIATGESSVKCPVCGKWPKRAFPPQKRGKEQGNGCEGGFGGKKRVLKGNLGVSEVKSAAKEQKWGGNGEKERLGRAGAGEEKEKGRKWAQFSLNVGKIGGENGEK